jgi:hypothetical protein
VIPNAPSRTSRATRTRSLVALVLGVLAVLLTAPAAHAAPALPAPSTPSATAASPFTDPPGALTRSSTTGVPRLPVAIPIVVFTARVAVKFGPKLIKKVVKGKSKDVAKQSARVAGQARSWAKKGIRRGEPTAQAARLNQLFLSLPDRAQGCIRRMIGYIAGDGPDVSNVARLLVECLVGAATYPRLKQPPKDPPEIPSRGVGLLAPASLAGAR